MVSTRLPGGNRRLACALGAALLAPALAAAPARAAKVVADGFEAGLGGWTVVRGGDGTFAAQGAEVATGVAAARFTISANAGSLAYARRALAPPLADLTFTFAGRVDAEGAGNSNVPLLRLLSPSGSRAVYVYRQNAASNKVYVSYGGGYFQTAGTLPLRTFARFALRVVVHGATSTVTLRENGATTYTTTTASLGSDPVAALQLGNETARQAGAAVIDDVAVYDATGSDTLIGSGPSGPTGSTSAAFAFSSPDAAATFQCNLDGGAYAACASPRAYAGLPNGPHTFGVRAVDAAGYVDPTPAQRAFAVDTVAPETALTSGPSGTVASAAASFTFASRDATATFRCSLDGGVEGPCTSPKAYAGLADGQHAFGVRAVDPAGNVDPTPAARTWTVASAPPAPPDTAITAGPSGTVATASVTFAFASPDGGTRFECALDAAAFAACSSPLTLSGLADGPHVLAVRAVGTGGADATPAARSFTVDTTAPETTIASGPAGTVASASVAFAFGSPDPTATFACSLDGAPLAPCTSPASYAGLADGPHLFAVRAADPAGNADASPATRAFAVDVESAAPPETSIDSGPDGPIAVATATFTFSANDRGAAFACSLDGAAFAPCASPVTYAGLADGPHTLRVQAANAAGPDPTPAVRAFAVDTTAPDTAIASGPVGPTPAAAATFAFGSPDATASFECSLDGVTFAACTSPTAFGALAQGPHTFQVRAVDAVGNVDASPAGRTWTVDTVPPATVLDAGPSGTIASGSATFAFHSPDATATFRCALDGAAPAACTSPATVDGLASGPHAFTVQAVDPAGNADPSPPTSSFAVGPGAPETAITAGPSGRVASAAASFDFSSDEAGATFECSLDDAPFAACAPPAAYAALAEGDHAFRVRAVGAAGPDPTPAVRTFTVDTVAPAVTARAPAPGDPDAAFSTTVTATFSEPLAPATVGAAAFTLTRDGAPVAAAVSLDAAGVVLRLTPAAPLQPNATYAATLAGGAGGVADLAGNRLAADVGWSFTTPAELVGAGDIADCGNGNTAPARTAALLAAIPGDVFTAGDNAYPHGAAADFAGCYDPSWGRERARTHPAIGNHELETQNGLPYYRYFGDAAGVPWVGDYSYDLGAWHIVVLNANCDVVGCGAGSAQETWLRDDLAAHPAACTLAVWHQPRFSSGLHGPDTRLTAFWKALYDYGADLVVNGHDHDYERFAPQTPSGTADPAFGITELVVGTGGAESRPRASTQPNSVVFATAFGVVRLVLHPGGYDWQFLPAAGSTFTDAGHADCHGAPVTPPAPAPYFGDGFEAGLGAFAVATGSGGSVATEGTVVRVGRSALQLAETAAATSFADARRAVVPARGELTASLDFRVAAEGVASGNVSALRLFDAAGNRVIGLYRQNLTGELWVKYDNQLVRVAPALPLDTWTRLTLHVVVGGAGASTVEVFQDGSRAYATATANLGTAPIASVELGNDSTAQRFTSYADDVVVTPGGP